jgi:hypothetical protein
MNEPTHTGSPLPTVEPDEGMVAEATPAWSFLGFELFDLVVVVIQVSILVLALPVELLREHMAVRFLLGTGFFWAVRRLAETSQYARGIESVRQFPVEPIMVGMGWLTGALIAGIFVFLPIQRGWRALFGDHTFMDDLLFLVAFPVVFLGAFIIPYCYVSAAGFDDEGDQPHERKRQIQGHRDGPAWQIYLARMFVLLLANVVLLHLESAFQDDSSDVGMSLVLAGFMLSFFYIPIRMQEMFVQPDGPHLRSLIQTLLALALCKTSAGWLLWF